MKEIAKIDYIIASAEFKIFVTNKTETDKVLNSLALEMPDVILQKYKINFKINLEIEQNQHIVNKDSFLRFQSYLKSANNLMQSQKKQLKNMALSKKNQDSGHSELIMALLKYDEDSLAYSDDDEEDGS